MNFKVKTAAISLLAMSLAFPYGYAEDSTPSAKKHTATKKAKTPPAPTVSEQIKQLRSDLESQIQSLKSDLATKDAQLKTAEQTATDAQATAAKAQATAAAAASAQSQAITDNAAAVATLQTTVTDIKGNEVSLATTVSDETAKMKKAIDSPSTLHYKGITLTPGGYLAGETVYRTKATGGDIPTAFSSIPYEGADAYRLSEFYGSARASRISLLAEGKVSWGTLRGYYEADFLGTGAGSNNNQSNSYDLRQRVLYAEAKTNSGWTFAGGQLWSLATEGKKGISSAPGDNAGPLAIDPNNVAGFIWARQYGFRVVKSEKKYALGLSVENPQLIYTASLAGSTPYAVLGSAGSSGGGNNSTISGCSPSTSIVNYSNQQATDGAGNLIDLAVPVYKTVNSCANVTNISFNQAPDVLVKAAFDPGFGHYEIFGIAGFAHETVYPGETTNGNLYGGLTDILATQKATIAAGGTATTVYAAPALTTVGAISNSIMVGGFGASARVPVIKNKLSIGAKGLYGPGVGRYGQSTLADVTSNAWGGLAPIHNLSGLLTVEATPNPRLTLYLNYGGDYAGRDDYAGVGTTLSAPNPCFADSAKDAIANGDTGCLNYDSVKKKYNLSLPATLTAQQVAKGSWGATWGTPSLAAVGYGSRLLTSSTACGAVAAPTYNGSSTGYYPGGSCSAQTRNVQEVTGGYWYDLYKGDHGRLRQGVQYGYAVREGWSSNTITGAKGIDNMFWTTFRYYLP